MLGRRQFILGAGLAGVESLSACDSANHAVVANRTTERRGHRRPGGSPAQRPDTSSTGPITNATATSATPADAVIAEFEGAIPHAWGTDVPGVDTRIDTTRPLVALTFDACGGPHGSGVDHALLDLLEREQLPATLFLNERWIDANPGTTDSLIANPLFEIGNHGTMHRPLSVDGRSAYGITGCRSVAEAVAEVEYNHERLTGLLGHPPRWFRAGTAYYDDIGAEIVRALGETPVSFAINGDAGATFTPRQIVQVVGDASDGAIVLMHMNQPRGHTAAGLAAVLPRLRQQGTIFVTLSEAHLPLI